MPISHWPKTFVYDIISALIILIHLMIITLSALNLQLSDLMPLLYENIFIRIAYPSSSALQRLGAVAIRKPKGDLGRLVHHVLHNTDQSVDRPIRYGESNGALHPSISSLVAEI